jgi:RNA polymerase sigma-70 factor (ECF subfamily)
MSVRTSESTSSTSASLIGRARFGDADAWSRLVTIYSPVVYRWGRQAGLQDSDAADVMQDVFRDVIGGLFRFRKEQPGDSFRGWLWTISRNRLRKHFNRVNNEPRAAGGTGAHQHMQQGSDFLEAEQIPHAAGVGAAVVQQAIELIRNEFQERTWQAFWRLTVAGESAAAIAEDLGMNEKAVRQAKYRILCRLREILRDD